MRGLPLFSVATIAAVALTACSGDDAGDTSGEPGGEPADRLAAAAELLDTTTGVRFSLEGENLPTTGNVIIGAEGSAVPPAALEADVRVIATGLTTTIEVISVAGELWALLPLTSDFAQVDAENLPFPDPAALIDPERGVSRLLTAATDVADAGQVRLGAEVLDQITATVPGELVEEVFAMADPSADVQATFALDPETGHVRQAELTGPFYDTGETQTYTVALSEYDQPVEISAPAD
jgi:lipoprotein LprG